MHFKGFQRIQQITSVDLLNSWKINEQQPTCAALDSIFSLPLLAANFPIMPNTGKNFINILVEFKER